jgi:hypothetical protein
MPTEAVTVAGVFLASSSFLRSLNQSQNPGGPGVLAALALIF